jgi:DNA polymerase-3 subunit delta'
MINNDISFPKPWWNRVNQGLNRRPSALLLVGPKGIGKTGLAIELAASWLCQSPLEDGSGCGSCQSCHWMSTSQHPDFRWVRPDADVEEGTGPSDEGKADLQETPVAGSDAKKKSQEIRIEQIRALSGFANVGSHRGGLRVVLISPANRMNYAAANALLKTLEEPAQSLVFILVADRLRGIPATVLSRCRRIDLGVDAQALSQIQTQNSEAAAWLIPLLVSGQIDPIRWAEKAGKSPPADAIDLLVRWMTDASRVASGLAPRAFPQEGTALKEQALRMKSPQRWFQMLAEIQASRAVAEHPLNPKLFYESIFDRYRRAQ